MRTSRGRSSTRAHLRMIRLVAVAQQRHQFAVIVAQDAIHLAGLGILHFHQRGPVVIAAQAARRIALHEGGVGGAPAGARAQIAQQVEHQAAEGIMPGLAARTGAVDIDAERLVIGAMLFQFVPIAGGQRQAVAVVDGALGNLAHDLLQARIVLVAARRHRPAPPACLRRSWRRCAAPAMYAGFGHHQRRRRSRRRRRAAVRRGMRGTARAAAVSRALPAAEIDLSRIPNIAKFASIAVRP